MIETKKDQRLQILFRLGQEIRERNDRIPRLPETARRENNKPRQRILAALQNQPAQTRG